MFDRSRTPFHDKKAAQHFHCAVSKVFDRVKSVALWSANIRKLAKDHKGYGSAARSGHVQHYVIKFVSDLRQVGDFLRVLRFPPPIKQTSTI